MCTQVPALPAPCRCAHTGVFCCVTVSLGNGSGMGAPLCASHSESPKPCSAAQRGATGPGQALEEHHSLRELTKTGCHVRLAGVTGRTAHRARCLPPTGATRTAWLGAPRVLPEASHPGSAPARQKRAQRAGSGGRRAPRNPLPRSPPGGGQARPTARRLPLPPPLPRGPPRHLSGAGAGAERGARSAAAAMAFEALAEAAERWCARTPFQLIAAEETERRMDFYAEPGVSFYVLCPEAACGDNFVSDRGGGRRGGRC